ncbi:MAG: NusG domain II-containing protein [Lachnospiraceae bacterium]|nr:NusG domain II-containing protein [Lachnospiraceae bacterium]
MNTSNKKNGKYTLFFAALLLLLGLGSIIALCLPAKAPFGYIAELYQSGRLIRKIPLNELEEPYTFIVEDENGGSNEIEVRPGSIGILSADCPDHICVSQGFISDSRLPITCLPHRLVIRLRPAQSHNSSDDLAPDILTY